MIIHFDESIEGYNSLEEFEEDQSERVFFASGRLMDVVDAVNDYKDRKPHVTREFHTYYIDGEYVALYD